MIKKDIHPLSLYFFEHFLAYKKIGHFISTRNGGYSKTPYHALNLALHVGDHDETVLENRKLLADTLEFPLENFVAADQVHQDKIAVVTKEHKGRGVQTQANAIEATDAMITDEPNICLMILVADCVPILFYDPKQNIIGVAHAGWKGTLQSIVYKTIEAMTKNFGCDPRNIVAGIGPSVGPDCYEVEQDVSEQFKNTFPENVNMFSINSSGTTHLNLWQINKNQLLKAGVLEKNIDIVGICTHCQSDQFFSVRHDGKHTGRFGVGIWQH